MNTPETNINPLEFPIEYFEVQVQFAQKWSELSGDAFSETLLTKTALYRRLVGVSDSSGDTRTEWDEIISGINQSSEVSDITAQIFAAYSSNPRSSYIVPEHTSALGYDYLPETKTVKIHFTNPKRGEKPLSDENMDRRHDEFRALLVRVREEHPEAALLMSASWLRSTSHYRELSPNNIAPQEDLMSTDMSFGGNSVWGQFIDASGYVNSRVYEQFKEAVASASTLEELVRAFPYRTLKAVDPIDIYYDYYGLTDEPAVSTN